MCHIETVAYYSAIKKSVIMTPVGKMGGTVHCHVKEDKPDWDTQTHIPEGNTYVGTISI